MKEKNIEKTNVMRILTQKKIPHEQRCYLDSGAVSGREVAKALGQDERCVFKTLVTRGHSKKYYVFVIPVCGELNLKKAAKAAGEKSIEMIPQKELLPLTGYIHGGCSPVGMKKPFPTFVDASAKQREHIMVSAGKIGYQVELSPQDLAKAVPLSFADIADFEDGEQKDGK
ncbi:MAG: Cys-tRNA(Pro) deacylase [Clostridia bacterium]|nr:Cys-tRNA(Pro) deacylase [Clostridia bacterium]